MLLDMKIYISLTPALKFYPSSARLARYIFHVWVYDYTAAEAGGALACDSKHQLFMKFFAVIGGWLYLPPGKAEEPLGFSHSLVPLHSPRGGKGTDM